jgi:hypothetical protein
MSHRYEMHGLQLTSALELPELRHCRADGAARRAADIDIAFGAAPFRLDALLATVDGYQIGVAEILLSVPSVGRYWASRGRAVVIDPAAGADPGALRLYLMGSAMGALLHQRGLLPLHASAIECNGRCVAFLGDSGAGKSTLAAMLARRGYRVLSDDVLIVPSAPDGTPHAQPSAPVLKLWPEALSVSGFSDADAPFECADFNKHHIEARKVFAEDRCPIAQLYVLRWQLPARAQPEVVELSPFEAMVAIRKNVYRSVLIEAMGRETQYMSFAEALLRRVRVFEFRRPMDLSRADAQIDALEQQFRAG